MRPWGWIGSTAFGSIVVYCIWFYVKAWLEIKVSPREPGFICPVHGLIPKSGVIRWDMFEAETCAICFHEKLKGAEHGFK